MQHAEAAHGLVARLVVERIVLAPLGFGSGKKPPIKLLAFPRRELMDPLEKLRDSLRHPTSIAGGAAPVLVDHTAEVPSAIEAIVKGGYYHAGQVCVSVQRILVHRSIQAEFTDRLTARVAALSVGDPLLLETDVGPLIHPREVERVSSWL